jgi:D-alanyl-lipoteichoic acid acyltransferase DltB (MBOAT superfamily)
MLFNSLQFAIFLPVVLTIYYLLPHHAQNRFLLAASILFYAAWDWKFLFPLLFSTSIDYFAAARMEALVRAGEPQHRLRKYLIVSIVTNLGLLGFFKYYNFFNVSLTNLLQAFGWHVEAATLNIILPIGISFYTFQALSYTIDVYRGHLHSTRHFADFLLAVLYFPHLVAGPIQRANNLIGQVVNPRVITAEKVAAGLHLMFWGFFKKVFVADSLAPIVNSIFANPLPTGFETLMGVLAFAMQIYCDFSGYTDIARGVAKLMGFEFVLNFNLPYFATNPTDFWSRWHISLSSWLRDYLYIPLGGNRHGTWRTYRNLMVTMVVGGLWHGAAWTFVLWGFYHGSLLVLHRVISPLSKRVLPERSVPARIVSIVIMFLFTCYGWLLFRASSLEQIRVMTEALMHPLDHVDGNTALTVFLISSPVLVIQLVQYLSRRLDFLDFPWMPATARAVCYSVFTYFVLFRGGEPQAFIYFQF